MPKEDIKSIRNQIEEKEAELQGLVEMMANREKIKAHSIATTLYHIESVPSLSFMRASVYNQSRLK